MAGTLKEISENYEKLHRVEMIQILLKETSNYVWNVVSKLNDEFDDEEDFEDEITKNTIARVKQDLEVLKEYL